MKKIILTIILTLLSKTIHAHVNEKTELYTAQFITKLENNKQIEAAMVSAIDASQRMLTDVKADEVVQNTTNSLIELRNEEIIKETKDGFGLELLFGLINMNAERNKTVTQVMTLNSSEVAHFPTQIAQKFNSLRKTLKEYIQENQDGITWAKAYAAKALQLSIKLAPEKQSIYLPTLKRLAQRVQFINFIGIQEINHCIITHTISKNNSKSFGLDSFILSASYKKSEKYKAHEQQECTQLQKTVEINSQELANIKMLQLDVAIETSLKILGLQEVTNTTDSNFQSWGLPYY